jgi:hypothetical protein
MRTVAFWVINLAGSCAQLKDPCTQLAGPCAQLAGAVKISKMGKSQESKQRKVKVIAKNG